MKVDNEIKQLRKEENDRKKKKDEISKKLIEIMNEHIDELTADPYFSSLPGLHL